MGHLDFRTKTPATLVASVFFHRRRVVDRQSLLIGHLHFQFDRIDRSVVAESKTPAMTYCFFFNISIFALYNFSTNLFLSTSTRRP
jgi:hypothetical protein